MSDVEAKRWGAGGPPEVHHRAEFHPVPPLQDVEALHRFIDASESMRDYQEAEDALKTLLARLEQTEATLVEIAQNGYERVLQKRYEEVLARLEQAERVNRGRYGEVITDLQKRIVELERERDQQYKDATWERDNAVKAEARVQELERELDEAHERIELRADEDSIYKVYDAEVERRQAAERALREIETQATRHKRAADEYTYLLRDLEFIEEKARAALASEGEEQQVPDRILGVDLTNG